MDITIGVVGMVLFACAATGNVCAVLNDNTLPEVKVIAPAGFAISFCLTVICGVIVYGGICKWHVSRKP